MIYSAEILTLFFAMATGFAAAWIGLELARLAGWREPGGDANPAGLARMGGELLLAALIGPRLLLVNGLRNLRGGTVSLPLYAMLALVAAGWSVCSGVVVLQIASASGQFPA